MKTFSLSLPGMYGDHHVIEVRRLLLALPGISAVQASSAFRLAEITFDPGVTSEQAITTVLEDAAYLQEPQIPLETGVAAYGGNGNGGTFRHTTAYNQTQKTISFARQTTTTGRPLWPCPGIGVVRKHDEQGD